MPDRRATARAAAWLPPPKPKARVSRVFRSHRERAARAVAADTGGRSLLTPSPLSSRPVVMVYGAADNAFVLMFARSPSHIGKFTIALKR